jgi:hypothetical protein
MSNTPVTDFSGRALSVDPHGGTSLEGLAFNSQDGTVTFPEGTRAVRVANDDGTSLLVARLPANNRIVVLCSRFNELADLRPDHANLFAVRDINFIRESWERISAEKDCEDLSNETVEAVRGAWKEAGIIRMNPARPWATDVDEGEDIAYRLPEGAFGFKGNDGEFEFITFTAGERTLFGMERRIPKEPTKEEIALRADPNFIGIIGNVNAWRVHVASGLIEALDKLEGDNK